MSQEKPTMKETIRSKRKLILIMLSTPLMGMAISIGLILYLGYEKAPLYIAIIFFLIVQYGVFLIYINGRFNAILNQEN